VSSRPVGWAINLTVEQLHPEAECGVSGQACNALHPHLACYAQAVTPPGSWEADAHLSAEAVAKETVQNEAEKQGTSETY
jgi:hypothetical protein